MADAPLSLFTNKEMMKYKEDNLGYLLLLFMSLLVFVVLKYGAGSTIVWIKLQPMKCLK